jgi:hypothetical protein
MFDLISVPDLVNCPMLALTTINTSLGPTAMSGEAGSCAVSVRPCQLYKGVGTTGPGVVGAFGAGPGAEISNSKGKGKLDCEYLAISAFWARYWSIGTAGRNGCGNGVEVAAIGAFGAGPGASGS